MTLVFGLAVSGQAAADWAGAAFGRDARSPTPGGAVLIEDLATLRDLGPISLSPDRRWLAFSVRQAVLDEDRYVLRWFVAPVDGSTEPRPVQDDRGEPLVDYLYGLPYASITAEKAKWSPDGGRIAYRRRIGDRVGLVVASVADGAVREIDAGDVNVLDVDWLADGGLVYRAGLDVAAFKTAVESEARSGWLLDGRMPLFAARDPSPTRPDCRAAPALTCSNQVFVVDEAGRRAARPAEIAWLESRAQSTPSPRSGVVGEPRADGLRAWTELSDPAQDKATAPLMRVVLGGRKGGVCRACESMFLRAVGAMPTGDAAWFVKGASGTGRADDLPRDENALYVWRPASGSLRKVLQTSSQLEDCVRSGWELICTAEAPTQPKAIVAVSLRSGRLRVIADPNPGFAGKQYPRVRKIFFADREGRPAFAHVVYPLEYEAGVRYPLVLTQYASRGYLRGQVGGAHAIFDLSARGFVVLSVDRPEDWEGRQTLDAVGVYRRGLGPGLPDRASAFEANEAAVDRLVAEGLVDPHRLAITGVSAGAENVHYTLQRTARYAAAVADSGSHDMSFMALVPPGPRRATLQRMFSMRGLSPGPGDALSELAWSNKPERLQTPLLITAGAHQALIGFEGVQALIAADRPIEMKIFPEEMHIFYSPRRIVALQRLNRAWLEFWLLGREDPAGDVFEQYARWRTMRAKLSEPADRQAQATSPGSTTPSSGR
ncbi:Atxe2 family lasso peptide isopeptidase [Phenylobacterium sp. LjRoot164]|uniref:Atxe2 family lasso peptide isopeptidase n=1 Tax=unclassified Phenylobacterium TaxID=2640670 RepID=UPI003ECC9342